MRLSRVTVAAVGAAALALVTPTSAVAHRGGPVVSDPIVTGLAGPLQLDVDHHGSIYVTQSFAATLSKVRRDGTVVNLVSEPGGEARDVSGPAVGKHGVAFASTLFDENAREAFIKVRKSNGTVKTVADLWAYEQSENPDADSTYGFLDLDPACAAQVPAEIGGEPYTGIVDSHPYALANAWGGGWYVADAGMNAILHVSKRGRISTVAVLPPQPTVVTAEGAAASGLPACTVGATYAFEPVPTDVEVGRGGKLVVSLLPGGPEDPSLGARGSVWKVNAWSGRSRMIGSGFLGATNVALGDHGDIYVAELFGNKVTKLGWNGRNKTVAELTNPAGIEFRKGKIYVSYDVFANGSIATIKVSRHKHHHHR